MQHGWGLHADELKKSHLSVSPKQNWNQESLECATITYHLPSRSSCFCAGHLICEGLERAAGKGPFRSCSTIGTQFHVSITGEVMTLCGSKGGTAGPRRSGVHMLIGPMLCLNIYLKQNNYVSHLYSITSFSFIHPIICSYVYAWHSATNERTGPGIRRMVVLALWDHDAKQVKYHVL
jgi:hypothetical protein